MRRFLIATVVFAILVAAASSCGNAAKRSREASEARALGKAQAVELSSSADLDTVDIERVLVDVRAREAELRRRGRADVADVYLGSFLSTLDSVNPSLSAELR